MAVSNWIFPPAASPTFFNNSYLETNVLTYLNTSTSSWPSSGFGKTATYHADALTIKWPANRSPSGDRNLHCIPCRQNLNSTDEALNWDACRYGTDENLPSLYTVSVPFHVTQNSDTSIWNLNHAFSLPATTTRQSLMCLFGIPGSSPYDMTVPFRFVNQGRKEATGENMYIFNASAPEGNPMYMPPPKTSDPESEYEEWKFANAGIIGVIIGSCVLVFGLSFAIIAFIKHRKNKKAAATAGKAEVSKEEEAAENVLPPYEAPPPAYTGHSPRATA